MLSSSKTAQPAAATPLGILEECMGQLEKLVAASLKGGVFAGEAATLQGLPQSKAPRLCSRTTLSATTRTALFAAYSTCLSTQTTRLRSRPSSAASWLLQCPRACKGCSRCCSCWPTPCVRYPPSWRTRCAGCDWGRGHDPFEAPLSSTIAAVPRRTMCPPHHPPFPCCVCAAADQGRHARLQAARCAGQGLPAAQAGQGPGWRRCSWSWRRGWGWWW
jgi:hypothetical protein